MNLLFVCSRNQWRSPTAEAIYKDQSGYHVRSAGTEPSARIRVSAKLIQWADWIFVMEKRHKERLIEKFRAEVISKQVIILDIPDNYNYMDEALIDCIKATVSPYLEAS